jgi:hypothetical protein
MDSNTRNSPYTWPSILYQAGYPACIDVGNLLELPAAAVLLCGCRSWLPVAAALGSSNGAASGATSCCSGCAADSAASRLREVRAARERRALALRGTFIRTVPRNVTLNVPNF